MISTVIWIGLQACTYLWTSQLGPQAVQAEACLLTCASDEWAVSPGSHLLQEEGSKVDEGASACLLRARHVCLRLVLVRPSLVARELTAIQAEIVYIHLIRGEVMEGYAVRRSPDAALFLEAVYLLILLQLRAKQQSL